MTVLVTGAEGFIGRHLVEALRRRAGVDVRCADVATPRAELDDALRTADFLFHLAGANRPVDPAEFSRVNVGLTEQLCATLAEAGRRPVIVFASSTQAQLDNPYGESKLRAEAVLRAHAEATASDVRIYRLTNVFGKWCRPKYNSVVATFCHAVANGQEYRVDDPDRDLTLVYIDDVIGAFMGELERPPGSGTRYCDAGPTWQTTLGDLAGRIESFREIRSSLLLPDMSDRFTASLYGTYLTYLPTNAFAYDLLQRSDQRGALAEFLKAPGLGQIFVSRTRPGAVRGNHFHHTKAEKFLVLEGEAIIRFRSIAGSEVIEYPVSGRDFRVVDIPPGFVHSIENVGDGDVVVLFWASEVFDPQRSDTYTDEADRVSA